MVVLKKNIFSIVEIGSSKIICVIFSLNKEEIKILGYGIEIARGIKNGLISNVKEAISCIASTVEKAESYYGKTIEEVYVVISSCYIESEVITEEILINGRDVTDKDIKNLLSKASDSLNHNNERTILHSINNGYGLDGLYVSNPIGMCANKLEVSTNFISAPRIHLININQVFAQCHLNIKSYLVASYMNSYVCLTEDDKNIGATIIDFGAHNTSVITFKNGCLISCYTQNIGSSYITFDIAHAFGNSLLEAEKAKLMFASLILNDNEDEKISLKFDNQKEGVIIRKSDFLLVIIARQEEIIENIIQRANEIHQTFSERKIIITGGGSKIDGLTNMLAEFIPCRLIKNLEDLILPKIENEFKDFSKNEPSLSVIFGAVKYLYQLFYECYNEESVIHKKTTYKFKSIFNMFKLKN